MESCCSALVTVEPSSILSAASASFASVTAWVSVAITSRSATQDDAVVWKLPAVPTKKLVELALVIPGAPAATGAGAPGVAGVWLTVVPENWALAALRIC